MQSLRLNGEWELIERPLADQAAAAPAVLAAPATLAGQVPGDVSDSLVRAGRLPEPLVGTNFEQFRWVEERSWWFRKRFSVPAAWATAAAVELALDGLDVHADIWLNGTYLGHQVSAFYPFVAAVKTMLMPGAENVLLVRLTTGMERVPPAAKDFPLLAAVPTEDSRGYPERGDRRRIYLRKPAYVWGWDWGPHLATCGITGGAELRALDKAEIRDVALVTRLDGKDAVIAATVQLDYQTLTESAWANIAVSLTDETGKAFTVSRENCFVASGVSFHDVELRIPRARLWWPNGSGAQHRYTVRASAVLDGQTVEAAPFRYGVRTVEMENAPGRFGFKVNGIPIFIKGGNWIPCDSLYGRITEEKVTRLVEEAAEANFNCLRIWGGGRFEMDAFYEACDRLGILLWHDFMSACAPLPAHEEWFRDEFRKEAEYQVRRLHNRACLLLWCGNNEVSGCYTWFPQFKDHRDPGWMLYHQLLPRLVKSLAPHLPYWPTSPYGGKASISDPVTGDDHHWVVMSPDSKFWSCPEYWDSPERPIFNSEYGYGGPCCLESTRQYLGMETPDLFSAVGRQHTNTFYDIPRVNFSINEHYRDPAGLSLEDYILLGGLCQGLNLGYSLESLRANRQTRGGIFWMYDDTWGENGWTIIDYYLRRKISYYNVKRCLAPQRLVLRRGGQAFGADADEVLLLLLNDGEKPLKGTLRFGYLSYDGADRDLREIDYAVAPRSAAVIATCAVPTSERLRRGTLVAIPGSARALAPVSWRHCRFREAGVPPATVTLERTQVRGRDLQVTVSSRTFAHAVHFAVSGDCRLSDHYFDLLPGEKRTVVIYGGAGLAPETLAVQSVSRLSN